MRFQKAQPGDLFIYPHQEGSFVGMKVLDPTSDSDTLMLPLGPIFLHGLSCPTLIAEPAATVISFERDYVLRLPSRANGWISAPPSFDRHCIALAENGAYIRANHSPQPSEFSGCYVDMATGVIHANGIGRFQQFSKPPGVIVFAIEWELITDEQEPRTILSYLYNNEEMAR